MALFRKIVDEAVDLGVPEIVLNGYGEAFVPGASVTLRMSDGLAPARTVTTGPDGQFSFPGTPAGAFRLEAEEPVKHFRGALEGTLPENIATLAVTVQLLPLARVAGRVFEPDGVTPVTNATVRLTDPYTGAVVAETNTFPSGVALLTNIMEGTYQMTTTGGELFDVKIAPFTLSEPYTVH